MAISTGALLLAGAAISAGSAIQQSRVQDRLSKISAEQTALQAKGLDVQAQAEKTQTAQNELDRQRSLNRVLSAQRAVFGASGFASTSGSFQAIAARDISRAAEEKRLGRVFSGVRQAGFRTNLAQLASQIATTRAAGRLGRRTGALKATSSLLTTLGKTG